MNAYRLRDINTGAIAPPPDVFDPNTFKPETGWIIQYQDGGDWKVYRQPTEEELKTVRILARLDDLDAIVDEIRREYE